MAGPYQGAVSPSGYDVQAMSSAPAAANSTGRADGQPGAVIHTEDLTKVYPGTDFAAVDRLNLDVQAGEIFGLLGPERGRQDDHRRAC